MIKVKNIYLATDYIDKLEPFNGAYSTGIIYELENGSYYQAQSTDPLVAFSKLDIEVVNKLLKE